MLFGFFALCRKRGKQSVDNAVSEALLNHEFAPVRPLFGLPQSLLKISVPRCFHGVSHGNAELDALVALLDTAPQYAVNILLGVRRRSARHQHEELVPAPAPDQIAFPAAFP